MSGPLDLTATRKAHSRVLLLGLIIVPSKELCDSFAARAEKEDSSSLVRFNRDAFNFIAAHDQDQREAAAWLFLSKSRER